MQYAFRMSQQSEALQAFETARAHDKAGREPNSVADYERALALGLPRNERIQALLGLGSALRGVRRHDEAVRVLEAACAEFPEDAPLRVFLALSLHSAGQPRRAMVALLDVTLRFAPLANYTRAIGEHRDLLHNGSSEEDDVLELARQMSRLEFVRAFDRPFLLSVHPSIDIADPNAEEDTQVGKHLEAAANEPASFSRHHIYTLRKSSAELPSAITIGRSPKSDITLHDGLVSKVHALVRGAPGRWEISDAGSRNGTWVGHERLDASSPTRRIHSGDVLTFGRAAYYFLDAGGLFDKLRKRHAA